MTLKKETDNNPVLKEQRKDKKLEYSELALVLLRVILHVVSVPPTTPHPFKSLFFPFYLLIFFCIHDC